MADFQQLGSMGMVTIRLVEGLPDKVHFEVTTRLFDGKLLA